MPLKTARHVPVATYRIQLNRDFDFSRLTAELPYLRSLGISDIYCSPIFAAAPGSTHGYDVASYRRINPELGGEDGFRTLCDEVKKHGMGLLLDFVPNHMGVSGPFNSWWSNVLECGLNSPYADFFDIHWNGVRGTRVLVPVLENHYGLVLEQGLIRLGQEQGMFHLAYGDARFPICPECYGSLLQSAASRLPGPQERGALLEIAQAFEQLPQLGPADPIDAKRARHETVRALKARLHELLSARPPVAEALTAELAAFNGEPGNSRTFERLDRLIERQHYRLARWKTGAHEINYRRFFAIDTLVGLRIENDEVFRESHARIAELIREQKITGLRIDHIDGLWDPERYLGQLQELAQNDQPAPLYVLVEKIIEGDESLPDAWWTHGTTGYEFASDVAQLLVDHRSAERFERIYRAFVGDDTSFEKVVAASKALVLDEMFANAVNNLAQQLDDLLHDDRRWRDLTRHELTVAVRAIMAHLRVYRTYRRPGDAASVHDMRRIDLARDAALAAHPRLDPEPFRFVADLLTGRYPPLDASPDFLARALGWVMSFQQYTGAVMAKAVEDTAFYVHNRLIALNEVGGDPGDFGRPVDAFHRACALRAERTPLTQLTTSTHDTKLSEDARARLLALSEIPDEWEAWLADWRALNAAHKTNVDGREAPDANEEYRLYQSLLAAWPLDETLTEELRQRIRENLRKSISEAKRNTTWLNPNEPWLEACDRFVDALLDPARSEKFLASFGAIAGRVARLGLQNSLVQTALKLTTPGIPDFYQGNEGWDFSLVDPDNRRVVDFQRRHDLAASLDRRSWRDLLAGWRDGAVKQRLMRDLLRFRADHRALFQEGRYAPVAVSGRFAEHVVAFERSLNDERLLVTTPRLTAKLGCPPLGLIWDDTCLQIDRDITAWRNVLTGAVHPAGEKRLLAALTADFPIVILQPAPA